MERPSASAQLEPWNQLRSRDRSPRRCRHWTTLAGRGITVKTVSPSWTATEANAPAREVAGDYIAGFAQGNVSQRMAEPADVAGVVAMLVSDAGAWLTGQYLEADGRWPTD